MVKIGVYIDTIVYMLCGEDNAMPLKECGILCSKNILYEFNHMSFKSPILKNVED